MEKESNNKKIYIQTIPLKIPAERAFKFIKEDPLLEDVIYDYIEKQEDVEVFYYKGNCVVTNKGYHFADKRKYSAEEV